MCSVAGVHLSQQVGTRQVGIRGQLGWVPMGRVRAGMGLGSNGAGVHTLSVVGVYQVSSRCVVLLKCALSVLPS